MLVCLSVCLHSLVCGRPGPSPKTLNRFSCDTAQIVLVIFLQGGKGDPEYIAAFQQIVMPIAYEVGSLSKNNSFPTNSYAY